MAEEKEYISNTDRVITKTTEFLTNKRTRSVIFLSLTFTLILGVNALLPVIEGDSHYTANAVSTTYGEYQTLRQEDEHLRLTWGSEQNILLYKVQYIIAHPELTPDEQMTITVPDAFGVNMYTNFFYEHLFWYISTAVSLGSAIMLFYSLFNYLITSMKDRYKKYVMLEEELNTAVKQYLDPVTFEPWMDNVFNPRRKINQHKLNTKYKIDKLERRTPYRIKARLRAYFEGIRKGTPIDPPAKLNIFEKSYLRKKQRLLYLLDESYINEYVVSGRVRYFKHIYPMFVYNGENGVGRTVDSYSQIRSDAAKISSDAGGRIAMSVILTFLFAILATITIVTAYDQQPFWIVVTIISKIVPLFIQIPFAIDYSNNFMNKQLIGNLIARRSIGLLYLADLKGGAPHA